MRFSRGQRCAVKVRIDVDEEQRKEWSRYHPIRGVRPIPYKIVVVKVADLSEIVGIGALRHASRTNRGQNGFKMKLVLDCGPDISSCPPEPFSFREACNPDSNSRMELVHRKPLKFGRNTAFPTPRREQSRKCFRAEFCKARSPRAFDLTI